MIGVVAVMLRIVGVVLALQGVAVLAVMLELAGSR